MRKFNKIVGEGIINGTDGDDFIVGSDGDDFITMGSGLDIIRTGDGDDWLYFFNEKGTTVVLDYDVEHDLLGLMWPGTVVDTGDNIRYEAVNGATLILVGVEDWFG